MAIIQIAVKYGSCSSQFTQSNEGKAFLETTFNSRLNYKDRKKHITKYGEPDYKWTTSPSISPVVAATFPPATIKDDKAPFRSQEMYMEAVAPLAALLEHTDDEQTSSSERLFQWCSQLFGYWGMPLSISWP